MYPCPYCHTQLTWIPQYQQYYCYFCHRYVQAAPPPQQAPGHAYAPPANPAIAPQAHAPKPVQIGTQSPSGASADTPPSNAMAVPPTMSQTQQPVSPAPVVTVHAGQAQAKPPIEYASKGDPPQPARVQVAGQPPSHNEPIYLCKLCGTRLQVAEQRWFCPRCQQYK